MSVVRNMMKSEDGMKELLGMMTPEEKERMCGNLRSIQAKGEVLSSCTETYKQAMEQADVAYRHNTGWKLTKKGQKFLELSA